VFFAGIASLHSGVADFAYEFYDISNIGEGVSYAKSISNIEGFNSGACAGCSNP
jgi:hypothetical protein